MEKEKRSESQNVKTRIMKDLNLITDLLAKCQSGNKTSFKTCSSLNSYTNPTTSHASNFYQYPKYCNSSFWSGSSQNGYRVDRPRQNFSYKSRSYTKVNPNVYKTNNNLLQNTNPFKGAAAVSSRSVATILDNKKSSLSKKTKDDGTTALKINTVIVKDDNKEQVPVANFSVSDLNIQRANQGALTDSDSVSVKENAQLCNKKLEVEVEEVLVLNENLVDTKASEDHRQLTHNCLVGGDKANNIGVKTVSSVEVTFAADSFFTLVDRSEDSEQVCKLKDVSADICDTKNLENAISDKAQPVIAVINTELPVQNVVASKELTPVSNTKRFSEHVDDDVKSIVKSSKLVTEKPLLAQQKSVSSITCDKLFPGCSKQNVNWKSDVNSRHLKPTFAIDMKQLNKELESINSCLLRAKQHAVGIVPKSVPSQKLSCKKSSAVTSSFAISKNSLNSRYTLVNNTKSGLSHKNRKISAPITSKKSFEKSSNFLPVRGKQAKSHYCATNSRETTFLSGNDAIKSYKPKPVPGTSTYQGYDLTNITPQELVSLDHSSLLKLSAYVGSSNANQKSFVTKSQYKIVSKAKSIQSRHRKAHLQEPKNNSRFQRKAVPKTAKRGEQLSLLKKNLSSGSSRGERNNRYRKTNFVRIGNVHRHESRTQLAKTINFQPGEVGEKTVVTVRGIRFELDPTGKFLKPLLKDKENLDDSKTPLKRVYFGGRTFVGTSPGILTETSPQVRSVASRVLHRSIQTAVAATKKNSNQKNAYCIFFNRFGKCNRGTECMYTHDPSKVAVCPRFLRGSCKEDGCLFSHTLDPKKLPVCSFFLRDACTKKNCPYRHEVLKPDTELCQDFVRGFCESGHQCNKAHILRCPTHAAKGICTKVSCTYPHPPMKKRKTEENDTPSDLKNEQRENEEKDENFRYFDKMPSDAELTNESKNILFQYQSKAQPLPKYIPFRFQDDVDCLS